MERISRSRTVVLFFLPLLFVALAGWPASACVWEKTYTSDADFDEGILDGVNH